MTEHTPIWTYDYINGKYRLLKDHKLVVGIYADEKDTIGDMCSLLNRMQWTINDLLEACQLLIGTVDDFLPNIGQCVLQDYERLFQGLIKGRAAIAKATQ